MKQAHDEIKQTVEGIHASVCVHELQEKHKLVLPFADMVYRAIHTHGNPVKIMEKYLSTLYR
jgi:glycerol-3-phosphate dehydrogenase